jgi:hypothetical protein
VIKLGIMHDPRSIAEVLHRAADSVARLDAGVGSWIEQRDVISSDQAAFVGECSAATVRRRAAELAQQGRPIGLNIGGTWLISQARWLDDIRKRGGEPALVRAMYRVEKSTAKSASAQISIAGERSESA